MLRLTAFVAAVLISLAGLWLSVFGVEHFMALLPPLQSAHRYIRWTPMAVSFLPWFWIFGGSRQKKAAPEKDSRLTPLPSRSQRPL